MFPDVPLGWGALGIWIGLCCGLMIVGSALLYTWHRKRLVALAGH